MSNTGKKHEITVSFEPELSPSKYRWLKSYRRLDLSQVTQRMIDLKEVVKQIDEDWSNETAKYEQLVHVDFLGKEAPRRNYFNRAGVVSDKTLFPYDDKYYALIDCYDCLFPDCVQPMPQGAIRPPHCAYDDRKRARFPLDFYPIDGDPCESSLCTRGAIRSIFFEGHWLHSPVFLDDWWLDRSNMSIHLSNWAPYDIFHELRDVLDLCLIPTKAVELSLEDTQNLLKILKHALSDLQKDFFLATNVLIRMAQSRSFDSPETVLRVLCITASEFVICFFPCETECETHNCCDWAEYLHCLGHSMTYSISYFTEDHATALAAFVKTMLLREFGEYLNLETKNTCRKDLLLLKQAVASRRAEQDEDIDRHFGENKVPVALIVEIVRSLGLRANHERIRLRKAKEQKDLHRDFVSHCLDSFWNVVRCLVSIGEAALVILPDSERFADIAGVIFTSLAFCVIDGFEKDPDPECKYFKVSAAPLTRPLRYAEKVFMPMVTKTGKDTSGSPFDSIESVLRQTAQPDDVMDVVRGCFVRGWIDVGKCGFGYGDFVHWAGYDVCAYDPLFFWPSYNFPKNEVDSDIEDDEESDNSHTADAWVRDSSGNFLTEEAMEASYDYSLLHFVRSWGAPWQPESHSSFQPSFREAMRTVALSVMRLNMPNEVTLNIGSFLNRAWWPDVRRKCWSSSCELKFTCNLMEHKFNEVLPDTARQEINCKPCARCGIAWYCSEACRINDYKECHKQVCGFLPWQMQFTSAPAELELHRTVLEGLDTRAGSLPAYLAELEEAVAKTSPSGVTGSDDDNDDADWSDEGSWESVDDDNEQYTPDETQCSTMEIVKFFRHERIKKNR